MDDGQFTRDLHASLRRCPLQGMSCGAALFLDGAADNAAELARQAGKKSARPPVRALPAQIIDVDADCSDGGGADPASATANAVNSDAAAAVVLSTAALRDAVAAAAAAGSTLTSARVAATLTAERQTALAAFEARTLKLPLKDVKALCDQRGLDGAGTKGDMVERILLQRALGLRREQRAERGEGEESDKEGNESAVVSPAPSAPALVASAPSSPLNPPPRRNRIDIARFPASSAHSAAAVASSGGAADAFTVIVDTRERLSNAVRSPSGQSEWLRAQHSLRCVDAALPCGDYMFTVTATGAALPAIVERKTVEDLSTSLINSHFHEQKRLMRATRVPHLFLLLEGSLRPGSAATRSLDAADLKRVHSSVLTTAAVDGFTVVHTASPNDSAHCLRAIGQWLVTTYASDSGAPAPAPSIATAMEKMNALRRIITMKSVFPAMLATIHGCSEEAAMGLASQFGSVSNMHAAVVAAKADTAREAEFVRGVQAVKRRQREAVELSVTLMQLLGADQYQ